MADVECEMNFSTDEFTKRIMFGNVNEGLDKAVEEAGEEVKTLALTMIRSHLYPGHGYITGDLWRSYEGSVTGDTHGATVEVKSELFYAIFVEYGTYKMSPRLHFRVGVSETEEKISEILSDHIEGVVNG